MAAWSSVCAVSTPTQLHERLRDLLPSAQAETCQVVATFLDISGFSTFSKRGESFNSAIYLGSAYSTILSTYFPNADFFKPTGDGLMLIHQLPSSRTEVPHAVSVILAKCVSLVAAFGQITGDDYMINFPVPQSLGPGLTRGSAAASAHGLRRPPRALGAMCSPVIGGRRSRTTTPPIGREPGASVITVGDGARDGLSASARADDAAMRADARESVHLHFALPVTDGHLAARQ